MRHFNWYLCSLTALVFTSVQCHDSTGSITPPDDCSGDIQTVQKTTTTLNSNGSFYLQSPSAAGDCTTLYFFDFRWANPARHAEGKPPLLIKFTPDGPSGANIPHEASDGWWRIDFAPTPTTETGNTTVFSIVAHQPGSALLGDSVEVSGSIHYRLAPK